MKAVLAPLLVVFIFAIIVALLIQLVLQIINEKRLNKRLILAIELKGETSAVEEREHQALKVKKQGIKIPLRTIFIIFSIILIPTCLLAYLYDNTALFYLCLGIYAIGTLFYFFVSRRIRKRKEQFVTTFPQVIEFIAQATAGGKTMPEAMSLTAEKYDGIVGQVFSDISKSIQVGRSYVDAVRREAYKLDVTEFYYFSIMLITQFKTGGKVINLLNSLAETLHQNRSLKLKIKALAAQSKTSMYVMGVLPWLCVGGISLFSWEYVAVLFSTDIGNTVLFSCIGAEILALLLSKRMMQIDV